MLTLCDTMDCTHKALCLWYLPGKTTGVGCYFLLQGSWPKERAQSAGQAFTTELPGKMGLQYHRQTLGGTPGLWLTTSPGSSSIRDGRQEALLSRNQLTFSNRLHAGAQRGHTPENTWEFRISSQIMQRKPSLHEIWPQSLESWLILQMLKFRHEK